MMVCILFFVSTLSTSIYQDLRIEPLRSIIIAKQKTSAAKWGKNVAIYDYYLDVQWLCDSFFGCITFRRDTDTPELQLSITLSWQKKTSFGTNSYFSQSSFSWSLDLTLRHTPFLSFSPNSGVYMWFLFSLTFPSLTLQEQSSRLAFFQLLSFLFFFRFVEMCDFIGQIYTDTHTHHTHNKQIE